MNYLIIKKMIIVQTIVSLVLVGYAAGGAVLDNLPITF